MVTCKEAHALIAHAVDGRIALAVFEPLRQHLAVCASCREALDTQRRVKAVLAARPSESLSDGFAARLAARLDAEPRPELTGAAPAASVKRPRRLAVAPRDDADGAAGAERTRDRRTDERRIAAADRPLVREMTLLASPASDIAGWRNPAVWRTWAMWALPVAAALVMLIDPHIFENRGRQDGPKPQPVLGNAAPTDEGMLEWLARPSTTVDSLLVLGAKGATATPTAPSSSDRTSAGALAADGRDGGSAGGSSSSFAASAASSSRVDSGSAAQTPAAGGHVFAASSDRSTPGAPDREPTGASRGSADVRMADSRPSGDGRQVESAGVLGGSPRSTAVEDAARLANAWPAPTPMAASAAGSLPGTVVPNAVPTVLADRMAQDLRLTDAQRKKIEAIYDAQRQRLGEILEENRQRLTHERAETDEAVERVLTPRQRKRYRDMNANRGPALPISERAVPPGSSSTPQTLPNGLEITITPAAPPPPFYR